MYIIVVYNIKILVCVVRESEPFLLSYISYEYNIIYRLCVYSVVPTVYTVYTVYNVVYYRL